MDKPWLGFYDEGVAGVIDYPQGMTVPGILGQSAEVFANRPATILPWLVRSSILDARLSYRDLDVAANRFANGLMAMGVARGDRIALILPNVPQFITAFFGVLRAGAIVVPLDPQSPPEDLERRLVHCGVETVVVMGGAYQAVKAIQRNTRVTRVITTRSEEDAHPFVRALYHLAGDLRPQPARPDPRDYSYHLIASRSSTDRPQVALSPDDPAVLFYRSDAHEPLNAAVLTHRNLVAGCLSAVAWQTGAEPGSEVSLGLMPFFHPFGLQCALLTTLCLGGTVILFPGFDARLIRLSLDRFAPTLFVGDPELYEAVLGIPAIDKQNLKSIRLGLVGMGLLSTEARSWFESLTGGRVVESYGLAEAGGITHANPVRGLQKEGSLGLPLPGVSARIVNPATPALEMPVCEVGELALRGPQVSSQYWSGLARSGWVDEWILTGDLACMDEDGYFYILGRKTDSQEGLTEPETVRAA